MVTSPLSCNETATIRDWAPEHRRDSLSQRNRVSTIESNDEPKFQTRQGGHGGKVKMAGMIKTSKAGMVGSVQWSQRGEQCTMELEKEQGGYRGTSLIRKSPPPGPHNWAILRVLRWS